MNIYLYIYLSYLFTDFLRFHGEFKDFISKSNKKIINDNSYKQLIYKCSNDRIKKLESVTINDV